MSSYRAPRGMQDWTPDQQPAYRWIDSTLRQIAARYGFLPIDVPLVEHTETFTRSIGGGTDIVEKEMYSFETKGGESLTIRPEFTAGIARAYVENGMANLPQPVKLYTIGPLLRYERPGMGRYRQHTQCSLEIFGDSDPVLDAEVMAVIADFYTALGIGGLSFEINSIGCPRCRPPYVRDVLVPWLAARRERLGETDQMRLQKNPLRVLDTKDAAVQAMLADVPLLSEALCDECRAHFVALQQALDLLGLDTVVNPMLVRGFDYYTKTVFEIKSSALEGANNTLNGGGRYDGLVELMGGPQTPGVGTGIGFERVALAMAQLGITPPPLPTTQIYAVWFDAATKQEALRTIHELRQAGLCAEMAYAWGKRSFKSQMRAADKSPARFTLILGEQELSEGRVVVKEMATGEQHSVPRSELVVWLTAALGT